MAAEPVFTREQIKEDGRNRVAKTGGQVGGATAAVIVVQAACKARGWMHGELDTVVFGAYVTLVTIVAGALSNLSKLRGKS